MFVSGHISECVSRLSRGCKGKMHDVMLKWPQGSYLCCIQRLSLNPRADKPDCVTVFTDVCNMQMNQINRRHQSPHS